MNAIRTDKIPLRIRIAAKANSIWPLNRGRYWITKLLLYKFTEWPEKGSFHFRFGCFVDAPLGSWPKGYRELLLYQEIETNEVKIWSKVLKPGFNVVDGGANLGYFSLLAASKVGINGKVYAFEPVPYTCNSLKRNIQASRANNVIVHQCALSDRQGSSWINLVSEDPILGNSSLGVINGYTSQERLECKLILLDELLHYVQLHLIKLDIEGGELDALKGSINILERKEKPVITFEWNRLTAASFKYQPEVIQIFLNRFGYSLFIATQNGLKPFTSPRGDTQWIPMVWALTESHRKKYKI